MTSFVMQDALQRCGRLPNEADIQAALQEEEPDEDDDGDDQGAEDEGGESLEEMNRRAEDRATIFNFLETEAKEPQIRSVEPTQELGPEKDIYPDPLEAPTDPIESQASDAQALESPIQVVESQALEVQVIDSQALEAPIEPSAVECVKTRAEKIAERSAAVGYEVAHTLSEVWSDRLLEDEEASVEVAPTVVDSSPEMLSPPNTIFRAQPIDPKLFNAKTFGWVSDKITPEQRAKFIEACKIKLAGIVEKSGQPANRTWNQRIMVLGFRIQDLYRVYVGFIGFLVSKLGSL